MNKSEEENLSSPVRSHMAVKPEFYSQGGLWVFAYICVESEGLSM